jgi:hypothetical protein
MKVTARDALHQNAGKTVVFSALRRPPQFANGEIATASLS